MDNYQEAAATFAVYPDELYPVLGLAEECGEVSRLYAKLLRGDERYCEKTMSGGVVTTDFFQENLMKELGDVLWMIAAIATDNDMKLSDIANLNIQKLTGRKVAGIIKGDGDDR
jgi:NTP pyrophosphatase (non-canonical NTP hydrolase)